MKQVGHRCAFMMEKRIAYIILVENLREETVYNKFHCYIFKAVVTFFVCIVQHFTYVVEFTQSVIK
jgi:hypothetical protein